MTVPLDTYEILDLLSSLVDKNLVVFDVTTSRYTMMETVRQYATDRLEEGGERPLWIEKHAKYFVEFANESEVQLSGPEQREWLGRLNAELDNLRAAIETCIQQPEDSQCALQILGSLGRYWLMGGLVTEGRQRTSEALSQFGTSPPSAELAKALHVSGNLAYMQTDQKAARHFFSAASEMRLEIGDRVGEAGSRMNLATVEQSEGNALAAKAQFEKSLSIFEEVGDKRGISVSLECLGTVSHDLGEFDAALSYLNRSIALNRELGNRAAEANGLNNLGMLHRLFDDEWSARAAFERALAINTDLGLAAEASFNLANLSASARYDKDFARSLEYMRQALDSFWRVRALRHVMECLEEFSRLMHDTNKTERAVQLLGLSAAQRELLGTPPNPVSRKLLDQAKIELSAELGEARYAEHFESGRTLTLDLTIDELLALDSV